jgi:hypothetical protein
MEVNSVEDIVYALKKLRDEPDFRQAIIQNGKIKSQRFDCQALTDEWRGFLETVAIDHYDKWQLLSEVEKCIAWDRHKVNINQKNQALAIQQRVLVQLRADTLPYDLSEKP